MTAACALPAAPPPLPAVPIETDVRVELVADEPAPAGSLWVCVLLEPLDGRPFRVEPVAHADGRRPPALLELKVSWQDFAGTHPAAVGRTRSLVLEWSGSVPGSPGAPARLAARLEVGATEGVLARRLLVEGRLIGVDLLREGSRSGGMVLALPAATLDVARPGPPGALDEHLQSGAADGIFLAAVTAPPERHDEVLETLVAALPGVGGAARNAVCAALLYLTGETHGTDIHRWRTWWAERRRERR